MNAEILASFRANFPRLGSALHNLRDVPGELARQYPRILERLNLVWGSPEGNDYIESLLLTQRSQRAGFPAEVVSELIHLQLLHIGAYPQYQRIDPNDTYSWAT